LNFSSIKRRSPNRYPPLGSAQRSFPCFQRVLSDDRARFIVLFIWGSTWSHQMVFSCPVKSSPRGTHISPLLSNDSFEMPVPCQTYPLWNLSLMLSSRHLFSGDLWRRPPPRSPETPVVGHTSKRPVLGKRLERGFIAFGILWARGWGVRQGRRREGT